MCEVKTVINPTPTPRKLTDTRQAINHKFIIADQEGFLTVGLFEDGSPGELFITMTKDGTTVSGLLNTMASLTTLALQYGVPLEVLVKKFIGHRFEPTGFTANADIRFATSITDYVFRWLGCQFIQGFKELRRRNELGKS